MLVSWGPLAVTVDAVSWQDYLGGIIQYHCSSGRANHAVLITGFDRTGAFPPAELQHGRCLLLTICLLWDKWLKSITQFSVGSCWVRCHINYGGSVKITSSSHQPEESLFLSLLLQFCGTSSLLSQDHGCVCLYARRAHIRILALLSVWTTVGFTGLYHQSIRNCELLKCWLILWSVSFPSLMLSPVHEMSLPGSIPYWIVQNSWGPAWGIDGYVRVKIGGNVCGKSDKKWVVKAMGWDMFLNGSNKLIPS